MDSFIEYMIAKKQSAGLILKKILIYFAALTLGLVISLILMMFNTPMLISFVPMILVALVYLAYRINSSFDVEFEYILTNGELDIDKITHKRRRKRLVTTHCKAFTVFTKSGNKEYLSEENGDFARTIDASAHSSTYEDYYAIFFKNGQKIKLIFNPTQKMIDLFKIYAPRAIK